MDLVNQYVAKILLAIEDGHSIKRISEKAGVSYAYTHHWIQRLDEIGVIDRDDGVRVSDGAFREAFEHVSRTVLARDLALEDAYLLPNFTGMDYRYSHTDAVFLWTKRGYQIARDHRDYPIFIDVFEPDLEQWEGFFDEFGITHSIGDRIQGADPGIYFVLFPTDEFETSWVENAAVMPLDATVEWARQYEVNFQPALEMLDEMYDLGLGVEYRERNVMGR